MKQVFMNLIFNGIQAMNNGGTITISTRIFTPEATQQSPSFVQVEVKDTGIGSLTKISSIYSIRFLPARTKAAV